MPNATTSTSTASDSARLDAKRSLSTEAVDEIRRRIERAERQALEVFADEIEAQLADVREAGVRRRPFNVLAVGVKIGVDGCVYVKTGYNAIVPWDPARWDEDGLGQLSAAFVELPPELRREGLAEALKAEVEVVDPPASVLPPGLKWVLARIPQWLIERGEGA
jgi:hypothetical protein